MKRIRVLDEMLSAVCDDWSTTTATKPKEK